MSKTLDAGAEFHGFHVVIMLPVWYTFLSAYCVLDRMPCSFPILTAYHSPPTPQVWVLGLGGLSER